MNTAKCLSPVMRNLTLTRRFSPVLVRAYSDDIITHTGQKWDCDDYRLARFMNNPKQVNNNWAVNLIASVPPTASNKSVVWCDGGSGPEGHPRVYINLDKPGEHKCGYCGLRFFKKGAH